VWCLGNTPATWTTTYTPQIGDFIISPRAWINHSFSFPGGGMITWINLTQTQRANVTHRNTVWEITFLHPPDPVPAPMYRRLTSTCMQGVSWMCHPATSTYPFVWCSQHLPGVGPHQFEAPCLLDPTCQGPPPPESYNCSEASGVGHPTGATWTCYDPGTGLGQYSVANGHLNPLQACNDDCFPESYFCSGASGVGHPSGTQWDCYDPGNGTGTYSVANGHLNPSQACNDDCFPPSYFCSGASGVGHPSGLQWQCYDPGNGTGTYSVANGHLNPSQACNAACQPPETYNCIYDASSNAFSCIDPGNGLGFFNNPGTASADCNAAVLANTSPCVLESWNCHIWPPTALVGTCTDPGDGSGQYSVANGYANPHQDCVDACVNEALITIEYPLATDDPCKICCCEATQIAPGWPWTCIPGTQVMSVSHLNPCSCATMGSGMISCPEDITYGPLGYNCTYLPSGQPLCVGPTPGGTYTGPTGLTDCQAACSVIIINPSCAKITSCPCGWTAVTTNGVLTCDLINANGVTTNSMLPLIECTQFSSPTGQIIVPMVGDIFLHSGVNGNVTWTEVYVHDISGTITSMPVMRTKVHMPSCIIPTPIFI